jgi:hypothetical protein
MTILIALQGERTMKGFRKTQICTYAVLMAVVLMPFAMAHADSVNVTYFTIASTDQDANNLGIGSATNEVLNTLGTNGFPVLNPSAVYSGTTAPKDVTAAGELTYWSPALNSNVTQTGTAVAALPFDVPSNFFPPNGTGGNDGGAAGYQAAILSGTLTAPTAETISFSIGSDDMAFAYLDGSLVCSDGGVHASTPGTCTTPGLISAGSHSLQLFFVDINTVQSGLTFGVTTEGVETNATPEPGSIMLLGSGLLAMAGMVRRRFGRNA